MSSKLFSLLENNQNSCNFFPFLSCHVCARDKKKTENVLSRIDVCRGNGKHKNCEANRYEIIFKKIYIHTVHVGGKKRIWNRFERYICRQISGIWKKSRDKRKKRKDPIVVASSFGANRFPPLGETNFKKIVEIGNHNEIKFV